MGHGGRKAPNHNEGTSGELTSTSFAMDQANCRESSGQGTESKACVPCVSSEKSILAQGSTVDSTMFLGTALSQTTDVQSKSSGYHAPAVALDRSLRQRQGHQPGSESPVQVMVIAIINAVVGHWRQPPRAHVMYFCSCTPQ